MARDALDIVQPFLVELGSQNMREVQIVGGLGSFALGDPGIEILPDEQLIIAPSALDRSAISQFRDDAETDRRDLDILVKAAAPETIEVIRELAQETIGDELVLSVFGLHTLTELKNQQAHPIRSLRKTFVSDRYVQDNAASIAEAKKALFPFAVELDMTTLDNWHVLIGNNQALPVAHPGTIILNYLTRSISGLRTKDSAKVEAFSHNVFEKSPAVLEWIIDGQGRPQLELANILHGLREPHGAPRMLIGGKLQIKPYDPGVVRFHPAMLIKGNERAAQQAVSLSRLKSRVLHRAESSPALVSFFQKHVEHAKSIDKIVKND